MKAVFSDLDGTILDFITYSNEKSMTGINILKRNKIPLILVSSKTVSEMMPIHRQLKLKWPFIFENGGGITYPVTKGGETNYRLDIMGENSDVLKTKLKILKKTIKVPIKLLSEMDIDEIIEITGLSEKSAQLVTKRMASIPFVTRRSTELDLDEINSTLKEHDILVTKGGRFYHYSSLRANKGYSVQVVIQYLMIYLKIKSIVSIAIGDSENDLPMLYAVDHPFLVRKYDGSFIQSDSKKKITITEGIGPEGFTEAIRIIFKGRNKKNSNICAG